MSKKQHKNFVIRGESIDVNSIFEWLDNPSPVSIDSSVKKKMDNSNRVVKECLKDGLPHYGINTGFGSLANKRISDSDLEELQYNLIKSHASGVGELFEDDIVRLMMLLRANVLAMGYSGVRYEVLSYLVDFINRGELPAIPSQGSVGASGDLAPLAHLALALINDGLKLAPKEGLGLINGVQASLAVALVALKRSKKLMHNANSASALTVEGMRGSAKPFDKRIADVRPYEGHAEVSKFIREMIEGSEIIASHKSCSRVQDPYSLRCVPQVHGAVYDTLKYCETQFEKELGACTDNPLIFGDEVVSGGNFHGTSIALVCDHLSAAVAVLGSISERRIEQMINPKQGELPVKYLTPDAGLNSGFMIPHVVSTALSSENKTLAHPASVDSITTSGGQEDFVSMSMWAARKCLQIVKNTEKIVAIELLAAAQAIDMQEEKLSPGKGTLKLYDAIRRDVSTLKKDRVMADDIEIMLKWSLTL